MDTVVNGGWASYPVIMQVCSKSLKDSIERFFRVNLNSESNNTERLSKAFRDFIYLDTSEINEYLNVFIEAEATIIAVTPKIVSILLRTEQYHGGAHGWGFHMYASFEATTGKIITLKDIIVTNDLNQFLQVLHQEHEDYYNVPIEQISCAFAGSKLLLSEQSLNYSELSSIAIRKIKPFVRKEYWELLER